MNGRGQGWGRGNKKKIKIKKKQLTRKTELVCLIMQIEKTQTLENVCRFQHRTAPAIKSDITKVTKRNKYIVHAIEKNSETNLSWYGILFRFKHADNLAHLRSFLRIWINTPQSSQKSTFKGSCWWPGFNIWVYHFFWSPASNHHFQPIDQIYLQVLQLTSYKASKSHWTK